MAGVAFTYRSQFDKALRCYFQSFQMAKTYNDPVYQSMLFHNIGITYYKLKDYKKGLFYLQRSLDIDKSLGADNCMVHLNMSVCHVYLNDFKKARSRLNRAMEICGTDCPPQSVIHFTYTSGSIYLGLKQYDSAEVEFLSSYTISKGTGNLRMHLDNIILLAETYIKLGRLDRAVQYLKEGEKLSRQGIPFNMEMIKIHRRLAELYHSIENFEKASFYQKKYITLRDSIYDEELTTSLMKIEAEFQEHENKKKIATQNELLLVKEQVITRQRWLNFVAALLILTILAFFVFLLMNYREKKSLSILLERKVAERTIEMELNRDSLLKQLRQKDFQMQRLSVAGTETINTIAGLCSTSAREIREPSGHTLS